MSSISIVIPAFNIDSYIRLTIRKIRKVFGKGIEIIVVINDSRYKIIKIVEDIVKKDTNIKVLTFRKRLGKGRAILEGFKIAQGDILGFIDADGPFDLFAIKENLKELDSGKCDCIICSKWKGRTFRQVRQRFFRKIIGRLFNFIVRKWLNLNFMDTQAGAKFISKEVFKKIGYNFICIGFDFDVELIKRLVKNGARIKEVYITHYISGNTTVHIFREIPSIIFNLYRLKETN